LPLQAYLGVKTEPARELPDDEPRENEIEYISDKSGWEFSNA